MFNWLKNLTKSSDKFSETSENKSPDPTLATPNNLEKLFDPEVEEILKEFFAFSLDVFKEEVNKGEISILTIKQMAFSNYCQDEGAQLTGALRNDNLKQASVHVRNLCHIMELVDGGNICPIHEPFLKEYIERVRDFSEEELKKLSKINSLNI